MSAKYVVKSSEFKIISRLIEPIKHERTHMPADSK